MTLSLALILVLALSPFSFASAEDKIIIDFWHSFGSGIKLECIDIVIEAFNAIQDTYEVIGIFQGTVIFCRKRLTTPSTDAILYPVPAPVAQPDRAAAS